MQNNFDNFKLLTLDEMLISIDRLTRFKHPDIAYPRVFRDIIHKAFSHLSDKFIDELPPDVLRKHVKKVWSASYKQFFEVSEFDDLSHKILTKIPHFSFNINNDYTKELMKTPLYCANLLFNIDDKKLPKNLRIVKYTLLEAKNAHDYSDDLILEVSRNKKLLFPVQKLVIVEGITEDILLPAFADFIGESLSERGIFIFSAGGKTKIPSLYAQFKDELKIPIIIVFDYDANDLSEALKPHLRQKDKIIVNSKGEFEDLLSLSLIRRTLNSTYYNSEKTTFSELRQQNSMCANLEEYFRTRNLGEFKKALFAKLLSENIKYPTDVSEDIRKLIDDLI